MAARPTVLWMPGGVRTEIHLGTADTGGAFCLLRDEAPPGWSLPAHRHRREAETIHVLEGELAIGVDARAEVTIAAGQSIHIPRGVLHTGRNAGACALRRLVLFSPAGLERFFLEAGAAVAGDVDAAGALAAALRHGWEFERAG